MTKHVSRRQEIMDIALSVAEDTGIGSVTTTALARRMSFTEAALYRYFPSKTAIVAAMLQALSEQLFGTMPTDLALRLGGEPGAVVPLLARHVQRFTHRRSLLLELLLHAAGSRTEALLEAGHATLQEYVQRMTVFFSQCRTAGLTASPLPAEELARLWVCQLLGGFLSSRLANTPWLPTESAGFRAFVAQLSGAPPAASAVH